MRHPPHRHAVLVPIGLTAITVTIGLLAPTSLLPRIATTSRQALRRAREEEAGVSEIAVIALVTGLAALVVVAYMAIVRGKVEDEANNLPSSGS